MATTMIIKIVMLAIIATIAVYLLYLLFPIFIRLINWVVSWLNGIKPGRAKFLKKGGDFKTKIITSDEFPAINAGNTEGTGTKKEAYQLIDAPPYRVYTTPPSGNLQIISPPPKRVIAVAPSGVATIDPKQRQTKPGEITTLADALLPAMATGVITPEKPTEQEQEQELDIPPPRQPVIWEITDMGQTPLAEPFVPAKKPPIASPRPERMERPALTPSQGTARSRSWAADDLPPAIAEVVKNFSPPRRHFPRPETKGRLGTRLGMPSTAITKAAEEKRRAKEERRLPVLTPNDDDSPPEDEE